MPDPLSVRCGDPEARVERFCPSFYRFPVWTVVVTVRWLLGSCLLVRHEKSDTNLLYAVACAYAGKPSLPNSTSCELRKVLGLLSVLPQCIWMWSLLRFGFEGKSHVISTSLGHCRLLSRPPTEAGGRSHTCVGPQTCVVMVTWDRSAEGCLRWRGCTSASPSNPPTTRQRGHTAALSGQLFQGRTSGPSLPASPYCRAWCSVGVRETCIQLPGTTPLNSA